ncbi:hypothetical protein ALC57_02369 [Trachymyrmex cornetzi]|uniref:Uncharacterized protein n=1 Tax=Trachymyrmex cornetzi TaxID=471704 RepID=A0A195EJ79_9HYME|nr:hypothetical protein ALC57_02369 [Trachymyrmex cornetzi]
MPLEGVSSSFFGITCWYRAVTPVTVLGSTKCFTRPAENITALREVTKLSATHPGVFGRYASKREYLINESEGNQSIVNIFNFKAGSRAKYRKNMQTKSRTECRATPSAVIKRKLFWKHVYRHTLKTDSFIFVFEEVHSRSVGSSANAIENPIILHGQFSLPDVETPGDDSASSSRTVENSIGVAFSSVWLMCSRVDCRTQSRKVLGYLASLWEFSQFLQLPRPPFSAAPPEFNEKANSTRAILLYTARSSYSKTIMEVLSHLTCSYAIKSGLDFSRRREVWLFGYTTGNLEVNAIVDSFLCLVNGTKKLVNVLTAAKDIGFDPPVTSAYLRLCSLKSEKKRRFAKDASRTCRTSDLKSSLGDAFSLNKSRNEVPRQTLVTGCPPSSSLKCAKFYVLL